MPNLKTLPVMRFSIVTPAFNSERFISETIESVISQAGNFSIEYFIMDGGSTDRTGEIVQRYQSLLAEGSYPIQCNEVVIHWNSENDSGMYDAINKGFKNACGDIYAYINSDDIYLPGAFNTIAAVFTKYPEIEWLKGITSFISDKTTICFVGACNLYAQKWLAKGVYGRDLYFVEQDSVFWRKSLWEKVGEIDHSLKLAGDYYLWIAFSKHTPLVSVKAYLSCFRIVKGQLSSNMLEYRKEMNKISSPDSTLKKLIRKEKFIRRLFVFRKILPAWILPHVFRLFLSRQKYYLVIISLIGDIQFYDGDYYSINNKLTQLPSWRKD